MRIRKYLSPIIVGIVVLFFGLVVSKELNLYVSIENLDKVYHVLEGVVLGWFFYRYFTGSNFKMTNLNLIFVSLATVCFVGVLWEFAERLASVYSPIYFPGLYNWFHGGDLNDTLLDLVADMFGGASFVVASVLYSKAKIKEIWYTPAHAENYIKIEDR